MISKGIPSTVRTMSKPERRASRRCKITQVLRARPSDPASDHFEDVRGTLSVSRSGVYYHSNLKTYEVGMRLFVTLPFSEDPTAVNREYLLPALRKPVQRQVQPHVPPRVFQPRLEGLDRVVAASGGGVHFGQIQVELGLVSLHAHGGITELLSFRPLAL